MNLRSTAAVLAGLVLSVAPVLAGGGKTDVIRGTLNASLPKLRDGSYFRVYKYNVQAGVQYSFHLTSSNFDTFLWLQSSPTNISAKSAFAKDDDSGGGTNSLIRGNFKRAGTIYIVVNSYRGGETGNYTLTIRKGSMGGIAPPPGGGIRPKVPPVGGKPGGNRAGQIASLRYMIGVYDRTIAKMERLAQDAEQQAREALRGNRLTSYNAFMSSARTARSQAQRYRMQRAAAQAKLNRLLAGR